MPDLRLHDLGPEHRLLLACATTILTEKGKGRIELALSEGPDWRSVIGLAEWHRVSPFLYVHLRSNEGSSHIPDDVMARLEAAYYTTAARTALYREELESILDVLQRREIPCLLLKGGALLDTVYRDPGLRSMNDLDLLVPATHIDDADLALTETGWTPAENHRAEMRHSFRHFPPLMNPDRTVSVELHRELVSPPLLWDTDGVWRRARGAVSALRPSPEDLVAHIALHFFMDRQIRREGAIRELIDISETLRAHPDLQWRQLFAESQRQDMTGPLFCGIWTAGHLLDTKVPGWILDQVGSETQGALAFINQRVLGREAWPLRGLVPPSERYSATGVLRNVLGRLFPTRDYLARRYSELSSYRLVWQGRHLWDLTTRWAGSLVRLRTVSEGLMADRWLHSMYEIGGNQRPERRPG